LSVEGICLDAIQAPNRSIARQQGAWANTHRRPIAKTLSVLAGDHGAAFFSSGTLMQKAKDMSTQYLGIEVDDAFAIAEQVYV
jgi:hypothetical protein